MATLLERASALHQQIGQLGQIDVERAQFDKLRTRSDQLKICARAFVPVVAGVKLLDTHRIPFSSRPKASKELRSRPDVVRGALRTDWKAVANDQQLPTTLINPVDSYRQKLLDSGLTAWREHVDTTVPKISDGPLETLGKVGFSEQVNVIRGLRDQVTRLREALPSNEKAFDDLKRLSTEIRSAWGQLEGVPKAVVAFLTKAARREATFSDLSSDVQEWLKQRNLLQQLRIGLG